MKQDRISHAEALEDLVLAERKARQYKDELARAEKKIQEQERSIESLNKSLSLKEGLINSATTIISDLSGRIEDGADMIDGLIAIYYEDGHLKLDTKDSLLGVKRILEGKQ